MDLLAPRPGVRIYKAVRLRHNSDQDRKRLCSTPVLARDHRAPEHQPPAQREYFGVGVTVHGHAEVKRQHLYNPLPLRVTTPREGEGVRYLVATLQTTIVIHD